MQNNSQINIYWEKQGSDRLCGVHCINSLLQGPFYNEVDLANIALELDQKEQDLMMPQGNDNKDFLKYMQEGSNNVAEDGNYSIQVLTEALKKQSQLIIESVDSQINKGDDLSNEQGFICNSSCHWFAIKNIFGTWYNLNSTNRNGPEIISDFYLSAFLKSVKENGYTIFVVKGEFPISDKSFFPNVMKHQKWFSQEQIQSIFIHTLKQHDKSLKNKNYRLNINGTDERDLEEAIERSKQDQQPSQQSNYGILHENEENKDQVKEDQNQFKAFQGQGFNLSQGSDQVNLADYNKMNIDANEDPELLYVMQLSLQQKFENKPKEGFVISFRHPNGDKSDWTFDPVTSRIEDLYDYAKFKMPPNESYKYYIKQNYPQKLFTDLNQNLVEAGIEDHSILFIVKQ